ncbi:WYL domain-containing protein [Escherichia coli]|uniref:WYL domain-containing protein n=1 Tax=Escherichia coli TaxID=562 RepID=UPI000681272F|nr:WYL domain-containing protein [Escherichia coli]EFA8284820.1 WYL domain-containing protein [Escherichia coli O157]EEZ5826537.1 WYL domain-containing protein [Escherichia coli]EFG4662709.1 WYL domain-containing protein [Escherichia coli]EFH7028058.1 hypothetical protein [Escherichia coli]EFJ9136531.1 WYL domain-containing protein [Escherichia coli]
MFNTVSLIIVVILLCAVVSALITQKREKKKGSVDKVSDEILRIRSLGKKQPLYYSNATTRYEEIPPSVQKNRKINILKIGKVKYIAFSYIDSKGDFTHREVDVSSIDNEYLQGYCHLAKEYRTFRLDRIQGDVICRDTGEVILN